MKVSRTRVKICGVTSPDDAWAAVAAGADAVGVIFAESPRQVSLARAGEILAAVPPLVARVGVFVDPNPAEVAKAVSQLGLSAVQLCGDESPDTCAACASSGASVVKAFRAGETFDWAEVEPYRDVISACLIDTAAGSMRGGTGQVFVWDAVGEAPEWATLCVAGGLTPGTVGEAIASLHPFAVDVSSGVESSPGCKDPQLVADFVAAARVADERERG